MSQYCFLLPFPSNFFVVALALFLCGQKNEFASRALETLATQANRKTDEIWKIRLKCNYNVVQNCRRRCNLNSIDTTSVTSVIATCVTEVDHTAFDHMKSKPKRAFPSLRRHLPASYQNPSGRGVHTSFSYPQLPTQWLHGSVG